MLFGSVEVKERRYLNGLHLINVGFGNIVNGDKIVAIVSPDSAPAKRLIQNGKKEGLCIDATHGRKTKSCIFMENDRMVLSALLPETILERLKDPKIPVGQKKPGDTAK